MFLLHDKTSRRTSLRTSAFLIIVIKVLCCQTLTCRPEEYQIDNECCPMCPPGNRVETDCTESRLTSCLPCMSGTYMNKATGRRQCFHCTSCDTGSGLKVKTSCTTTSDTVCEPLEGFFCTNIIKDQCEAAQKHKDCDPGQYIKEKGTSSSDTVCSDCSDGTFSDGTLTSCHQHTQCESMNLQLKTAGTKSTDSVCGEQTSNVGVLVGVIIGVVVVLVILVVVVLYCIKRNSFTVTDKNNHADNFIENPQDTQQPEHELIPLSNGENPVIHSEPSMKLLNPADDTKVILLIQDGGQLCMDQRALSCSQNHLELNPLKTVDFRKRPPPTPPLTTLNRTVPTVDSFRFLGSTISWDLKWTSHIDSVRKKDQQRLYFLRELRKFILPQELLIIFYSAVIQSVLTASITVWFGSATRQDRDRLQRTIRSAERVIGTVKSPPTPHTPDTIYSDSSPQAGVTEHCTPKQPGTETVSFPRAVALMNSESSQST